MLLGSRASPSLAQRPSRQPRSGRTTPALTLILKVPMKRSKMEGGWDRQDRLGGLSLLLMLSKRWRPEGRAAGLVAIEASRVCD